MRDLIGKAEATQNEWLVYFVLEAETLPVADALKERVMDALVHNQDKKENGGSAPWRRPLVVGDTPINHAEFMAVVLFLCDMVDKSSNLLGKGNTLTTVVEYGINMHVSDTVPTSMTHQFFAAMVSMCWIVAVFIPSYLWGTVRVHVEGVESSGRDAPSAEWRTDGLDGEGEDSSHRAAQSDVSDLDYLSVATAVFWALFYKATAQVACLTSTLARANAAGLHSIELRWPEISKALRASGKYEPTTARDFYQYLQLLRRHRLAYKIAAKLFIACAYGLMVSRGLRPAKCPCFHSLLFVRAAFPHGPEPQMVVNMYLYWVLPRNAIILVVAGMLEIFHAERQEALTRAGHSGPLYLVISTCYLGFGGVSAARTTAVRTHLLLHCCLVDSHGSVRNSIPPSFFFSLSSLLVLPLVEFPPLLRGSWRPCTRRSSRHLHPLRVPAPGERHPLFDSVVYRPTQSSSKGHGEGAGPQRRDLHVFYLGHQERHWSQQRPRRRGDYARRNALPLYFAHVERRQRRR